jgi:signal peptide peptidase SppA
MNSTSQTLLTLFSRSAIWMITPKGLADFVFEIDAKTFFRSKKFALLKPTTLGKTFNNKVAVIPVQGILTKDCAWCGTTYPSIADAAEDAATDPNVKSVVLAVDSPGGEVIGLPETARVIRDLAQVKPLHAIVEGTSASAAYWLTAQASDITVAPSGEVGSVGVRMMHSDISKMLEDAGIKITELQAGRYKTEWSSFAPLTEDAKEDMQQRLDAVHADFLSAVGRGRGVRARAGIRAARFGEGRMFSADDALHNGLVDLVQSPRDFYRAVTPGNQEPTRNDEVARCRALLEIARNRC